MAQSSTVIEVLSHRGWWHVPPEKNSMESFQRAFAAGFGVETDVRDALGSLVISHDVPTGSEITFDSFLSLYCESGSRATVALNIKSDGLCELLARSLEKWKIPNYFVFDMSVPEMVRYEAAGFPFYTRLSEFEPAPVCLEGANGVWVDGFASDWTDFDSLDWLLAQGKSLAVVSPELHGRRSEPFWRKLYQWLSRIHLDDGVRVMLCTDQPEDARRFFNE
jgi:hypothetical protein